MLKASYYYDAVVVNADIDPNHAGAVRAKIIGVTDDFKDSDQPFVLPVVNSFMAVPTKGSYLRVEFDDGDINKGHYTHTSARTSILPQDYVDNYPNVAVSNLGSDSFYMVHNRQAKETTIYHDSSSKILWDSTGALSHDSDLAYGNAGYGAKQNAGTKIQPVLTAGTIDVFCCTPYGLTQGSEYLSVSHVSKKTVDGPTAMTPQTQDTSALEVGQTRPLNDTTVEFDESPSKTSTSNRTVSWIIVTNSGGTDFTSVFEKVMDSTKNVSYHYIIGLDSAAAVVGSDDLTKQGSTRNADSTGTPNGFIQCVELDDVATFGSTGTLDDGTKANLTSISVCLIGDGTSAYTEYQYGRLNDIINNAKSNYGDGIQLLTPDDVDYVPPISIGLFDASRF